MNDNLDNICNNLGASSIKRREYGTPIDCSYIIKPSSDHPKVYFPDNLPSSSRSKTAKSSNSSISAEKPYKTRRKKKQNKVSSKVVKGENPKPKNENFDDLTNNLKKLLSLPNDLKPQKSIIIENKQKNPGSRKSEVSKSAPSNAKSTKIIKNSKLKSKEEKNGHPDKTSLRSRHSFDGKNRRNSETKPNDKNKNYKRTPNKKKLNKSFVDEDIQFEDYITLDLVEEGLSKGEVFKGNIRINPKDHQTAYISNPIKTENDITIEGLKDRNRALDQDKVVYKIKDEQYSKSPKHKTAKVVHILEMVHPRTAIGILRLAIDKNKQFAIFHPRDARVPRMKILFMDWPPLFYDNANKYENVIYLAKIKEWSSTKFAIGALLENIGTSGDIKIETAAILRENCIDTTPYNDTFKKYYSKITENISENEIKNRLDLRKKCIFTIDPLTARDLDDAVSCNKLPNGNYEVGVHISDVGYFLDEGTPLDAIVCERATSTYMVESVYHMLPKELCFACSLLPGEDKLAFSVIWELTEKGEILNHRISRSIINSCTQLAYEHAQTIIDDPNCQLSAENLPQIHNSFKPEDIKITVQNLYKISANLRTTRFDTGGALRIDQPKLCFQIDPETCLPVSYRIYQQKESHRLIEEFMLLANMTVATYLKREYPDIAFLRCHLKPNNLMIEKLKELLEKVGILLDISSAGAFQQSLLAYSGNDELSLARMLVLSHLCAKTMNRAEYFCIGLPRRSDIDEEFDLKDYCWHYSLNVPLYTHFTSPIRRYADVMVHRLLAGALGYTERPDWLIEDVANIAANCNQRKYNAKKAGEQSLVLYYIQYVSKMGSLVEDAIVCEVRETSFDAMVMNSGITCRIFLNTLPRKAVYKIVDEDGKEIVLNNGKKHKDDNEKKEFTPDKKIKTLVIDWPERNPKNTPKQQSISMFTIVRLKLVKNAKKMQLDAELLKPM